MGVPGLGDSLAYPLWVVPSQLTVTENPLRVFLGKPTIHVYPLWVFLTVSNMLRKCNWMGFIMGRYREKLQHILALHKGPHLKFCLTEGSLCGPKSATSKKGPIFSKAILKCRWLLEHENLSKVSKYIGKFLKVFEYSKQLLFKIEKYIFILSNFGKIFRL